MTDPDYMNRVKAEHRCEWGNFGWACSCGAGRDWPLAPVDRARRAAQAHQRAALQRYRKQQS